MSGTRAPHLQRRDGVYCVRLRVSDALRPLVGQKKIVKSLKITRAGPLCHASKACARFGRTSCLAAGRNASPREP
ncbi:DUF6538 domain-containing protein [Candidatus Phycosocius bacilliformis]|uniref:DUF6538 domain-containing protein n=1 Tax=Candidatus Phycosocius bacilliformis TaxID=1445552 RepID=UPI003B969891